MNIHTKENFAAKRIRNTFDFRALGILELHIIKVYPFFKNWMLLGNYSYCLQGSTRVKYGMNLE